MGKDIYNIIVQRAGTQIGTIQHIQVDVMSQTEAAYYGGAAPYFRYMLHVDGVYDLQYRDLLLDPSTTDPETGASEQYRVINDPVPYSFGDHMKVVADRMVGS